MSGVLKNSQECDRVLRMIRPSPEEDSNTVCCMDALQAALRPEALFWTGSVGKSTALHGAHDLDVCVRLSAGLVGQPALQEIVKRLRDTRFEVVRCERRLVLARYANLEVDIMPQPTSGEDVDWWQRQIDHLHLFRQLSAAGKDAVRLLKAWARLRVQVPGILLEAVVTTLKASTAGDLFVAALHALSRQRPWLDPVRTGSDLSEVLDRQQWSSLERYAESSLKLMNVTIDTGTYCKQSFPCLHAVKLIFQDLPPANLGELTGFQVVELSVRLGLRRPKFGTYVNHFDAYPRVKNLHNLENDQGKCMDELLLNNHLRPTAISFLCKEIKNQFLLMQQEQGDSSVFIDGQQFASLALYTKVTLQAVKASIRVGDLCRGPYPCRHDTNLDFGNGSCIHLGELYCFEITQLADCLGLSRPAFLHDAGHFDRHVCPPALDELGEGVMARIYKQLGLLILVCAICTQLLDQEVQCGHCEQFQDRLKELTRLLQCCMERSDFCTAYQAASVIGELCDDLEKHRQEAVANIRTLLMENCRCSLLHLFIAQKIGSGEWPGWLCCRRRRT